MGSGCLRKSNHKGCLPRRARSVDPSNLRNTIILLQAIYNASYDMRSSMLLLNVFRML